MGSNQIAGRCHALSLFGQRRTCWCNKMVRERRWVGCRLASAALVILLSGCDLKPPIEPAQEAGSSQVSPTPPAAQSTNYSIPLAQSLQPLDSANHPGKALHDANCISCHDSSRYQTALRKVADFPALLQQVERCNNHLNPQLTPDAIQQIADYLNQAFYRYEKP